MKRKLLLGITSLIVGYSAQAQLGNLNVGDVAPNFTVTDLEGHVHQKADYAGKYLLIDMFFTTCGPCQGVSPIINEFYKKYGCNGYDINVLAVETSTTNAATHTYETQFGGDQNFLTPTCSGTEGGGITFKGLYQAEAYPTIIIIGPDGKLKNIDVWPVGSVANIESALTSAGATLTPKNCSTASISENNILEMNFYPNPTKGNISIQLNDYVSGKVNIKFYAINGTLVQEISKDLQNGNESMELSISDLEDGTYFVQVSNNDLKSELVKVVKY